MARMVWPPAFPGTLMVTDAVVASDDARIGRVTGSPSSTCTVICEDFPQIVPEAADTVHATSPPGATSPQEPSAYGHVTTGASGFDRDE